MDSITIAGKEVFIKHDMDSILRIERSFNDRPIYGLIQEPSYRFVVVSIFEGVRQDNSDVSFEETTKAVESMMKTLGADATARIAMKALYDTGFFKLGGKKGASKDAQAKA